MIEQSEEVLWNVIEVNEASFIIHPIHICACQGRVRKASQPQPPSNLYDKDTIDQSHREKISLKAKTDPTSQSGREKTGVQITELVGPIPEGLVIIFLLDLLPISKSLFGLGTWRCQALVLGLFDSSKQNKPVDNDFESGFLGRLRCST